MAPTTGTTVDEAPRAADEPVAAPGNGLVIQTAGGTRAIKLCATCNTELPAGWKHDNCQACFSNWLAERQNKVARELPQGMTYCGGRIGGKPCRVIVPKRPDRRPSFCSRCEARRLIADAEWRMNELGGDRSEELVRQLVLAEDLFVDQRFPEAAKEAHYFFTLQARLEVETGLAKVQEESLPKRAREAYERVLDLWSAQRYFDARRELSQMRETLLIEVELGRAGKAELSDYAQQAYEEAVAAFEAGNFSRARAALQQMHRIQSTVDELAEETVRRSENRSASLARKAARRASIGRWRRELIFGAFGVVTKG